MEKSIYIEDVNDLLFVVEEVGLFCILKLEYGFSVVGVKFCYDLEECIKMFIGFWEYLICELDYLGIGLGYGNSMVVMKFIVGMEYDVDLVLFER